MEDENTHAHSWHSQLGQSRSSLQKRPKHRSITSLASYLPESPRQPISNSIDEELGTDFDRSDFVTQVSATNSWCATPQPLRNHVQYPSKTARQQTHKNTGTSELKSPIRNDEYTSSETQGQYAPEQVPERTRQKADNDSHDVNRGPIEQEYLSLRRNLNGDTFFYPDMLETGFKSSSNYLAPARFPPTEPRKPAPPSAPYYPSTMKQTISRRPISVRTFYATAIAELADTSLAPNPSYMPMSGATEALTLNYQSQAINAPHLKPLQSAETANTQRKIPHNIVTPHRPRSEPVSSTTDANDVSWYADEKLKSLAENEMDNSSFLHDTQHPEPTRSHVEQNQDNLGEPLICVGNIVAEPEEIDESRNARAPTEVLPKKTPAYDNFYTPENEQFYAAKPYDTLKIELNEIRLLRVFAKKPLLKHYEAHPHWNAESSNKLDRREEFIACEMETTSLNRISGSYITLSYCAGDPKKTSAILVNGILFNAFANLAQAIDLLLANWLEQHDASEPLLLWADQICINQSNKDERSQQVQIMREIYRRSSETYVCLTSAKAENCLYWVTQVSPFFKSDEELPLSEHDHEPKGVRNFKQYLWNILMGKGKHQASQATVSRADDEKSPLIARNHETLKYNFDQSKAPSGAVALRSIFRDSSNAIHNGSARRTVTTFNKILEASYKDDLQALSAKFQSSLISFIMNDWWRRSWVYQEFLFSHFTWFISDGVAVSWSELSVLVDFVCNHLDEYMEEVRLHFESHITEEMRQKDREKQEIERNLREEEQQRQFMREQRKMKEEQERRRRIQEERRQRELHEERERRKIQAQRDAEERYEQSMEKFRSEQQHFESERLSQWKSAIETQNRQRAEYETQQLRKSQQDVRRLKLEKKSTIVISNLRRHYQINKELAALKVFEAEVSRPIDQQIKRAVKYSGRRLILKSDKELDQKSGGRMWDQNRLDRLLELNKVPDDPEKFRLTNLQPPTKPRPAALPMGRRLESAQTPATSQRATATARTAPRAWASEKHKDYTAIPSEPSEAGTESFSIDIESSDDDEYHHKNGIIERLGVREIEQRDKITRLQEDFRKLDRSALASMLKGKQKFQRQSDMIALLQHSRNCAASDARDRVYAFVGLADPNYNIVPDYSSDNTLERVLINTARSIIKRDQSLAILQHVHRGRANLGPKLPSWVPDWTSKEMTSAIDDIDLGDSPAFNASKNTRAVVEVDLLFKNSSMEHLKVRAVFVGQVQSIESGAGLDDMPLLSLFDDIKAFGPMSTRYDDEIWVLHGAKLPAVLTPAGNNQYGYLGDAIVLNNEIDLASSPFSNIMYGAMIDNVRAGTAVTKDLWII